MDLYVARSNATPQQLLEAGSDASVGPTDFL